MTSADTPGVSSPNPLPSRVAAALRRYQVSAWITSAWLIVLVVEMVAKYGFDNHALPEWIPQVHGIFYMLYLALTLDLAVKARWVPTKTAWVLLAGTIPVVSFLVERGVHREMTEAAR